MPDEVVVSTGDKTVSVPVEPSNTDDGIEVDSAWLTSTFDGIRTSMNELATSLTTLMQGQTQGMQLIEMMDAKIPSNLTTMIAEQQTTITSLVNQLQETARNIVSTQAITNTLTPPAQPETAIPEPQSVEVEKPVIDESTKPVIPKRRRI